MANIPLGTHFSDGVRSGPIYSSQLSATQLPDVNGVLTSSDYSTWGPGILRSPLQTYKAWPNPPAAGFTAANNIVSAITGPRVAGNLTLAGDNQVTFLTTGKDGMPLLQLDWPRVPVIRITTTAATANTRVTIFGYDWYGFPLQHTYVLTAATGNFPTIVDRAGATPGAITYPDNTTPLPCKAFWQITRIYMDTALPATSVLSIGADDIFGIPYLVTGSGNINSISWGSQNTPNSTDEIFPVSEWTVNAFGGPLDTVGVFVPADVTFPATATTGDVRGLYAPSTPASLQVDGLGNTLDCKRLVFTAYVAGMDTWQNQWAERQSVYMSQNGLTPPTLPQGFAVSPLSPFGAYGNPQFYTGVPS